MEERSLFYDPMNEPLAARLRPQSLDEIIGQKHLIGPGKVLRRMVENDQVPSLIFWGPPGVGKTTLASVIARHTKASFINFSAVTSGIKEIKEVMKKAEEDTALGHRTIVFVDEIHRFNKAQQDAFLPFVEKGAIILIGATTENPSFEVNGALLSRCKVFVLKQLEPEEIEELLKRAIKDPRAFNGKKIEIDDASYSFIANFCNGDARMALSTLEMAVLNGEEKGDTIKVDRDIIEEITSKKSFLYDKKGEEHYNII
ncbi:MAG: AAA family ATPase, partial [Erysipelotrichaceae bacterium]|nr:AAA family ATPase [Erysipelotrichaceae bacterium]